MAVQYASGTIVQANYMGTTADGLSVIPGTFADGFQVADSPDTLIGGTTPGTGNVISYGPWTSAYTANYASNAPGDFVGGAVWAPPAIDILNISSTNMGSAGTVVEGNKLGTDVTGTVALGNPGFGIDLVDVAGITIGGTTAGAGNIIAANSQGGIGFLSGSSPGVGDLGSSNDLVEGNFIGVNFDSLGNPIAGLGNGGMAFAYPSEEAGIYMNDPADPNQTSSGNTIGGMAAGSGNVISGNLAPGVVLSGAGVTENVVAGNWIGTSAMGTVAVGNTGDGLYINQASANTIGGTAIGAANLISGNSNGVELDDASGNLVQGDMIGIDQTGEVALGNSGAGVLVDGGSSANTIGGAVGGSRNVISGNVVGVSITDAATNANLVAGNLIGTDVTGSNAIGNLTGGINIAGGSSTTIGGTTTLAQCDLRQRRRRH